MRFAVCVMVCVALSGCAAREVQRVAPGAKIEVPGLTFEAASKEESLETFMAKVRALASEARPQRPAATTIEAHDRRLAAALITAVADPSPTSFRSVAREYKRLQIFDKAHEYLNRALHLHREDAATYDELARLWRDSGFPHLALGDANRAIYYAPRSPIVHNTMGTILHALGQKSGARAQFEAALQLDPSAGYALNNLCYGWIMDGNVPRAARACEEALKVNPRLTAASNNLGLAYAAAGNVAAAQTAFSQVGDTAAVMYNLGVVRLARREYREAARAFQKAQQARPSALTAARLRQAESLSAGGGTQ